jgi:hypothetical protein
VRGFSVGASRTASLFERERSPEPMLPSRTQEKETSS